MKLKLIILSLLAVPLLVFAGGVPVSAVGEDCDTDSLTLSSGASCSQGEGQSADLFGSEGIFQKITNILLFLIGAISVIMLIYGGIRYTISGGDSGQVTSAKNTIMYAVIGIIVALLAYAIVNFVISNLGVGGGQ